MRHVRVLLGSFLLAPLPLAQSIGEVLVPHKISSTAGSLGIPLADQDGFGTAVTSLGDVDGDGVTDVAVGAPGDDELGPDRGAAYVLFLASDGTVKSAQKINDAQGGLGGGLSDADAFGTSLTHLGDLNGDGRRELVVGAPATASNVNKGRVYLLYLDQDGIVTDQRVITQGSNGFSLSLQTTDPFGRSVGRIGDLDGNGTDDLAIGSLEGGDIFVVRLSSAGVVTNNWRIGNNIGGFAGTQSFAFGSDLIGVGDLNQDGIPDLAVGEADPSCVPCQGIYWILFMDWRGTVVSESQVRGSLSLFGPYWETRGSGFGEGLAAIGDVDGDGVMDLAVSGPSENNASCACGPDPERVPQAGAVWVLGLDPSGSPHSQQKINVDEGNLVGFLEEYDHFGADVEALGDFDGDGKQDLVVGAPGDDDGGANRGAIYVLELQGVAHPAASRTYNGTHLNRLCSSTTALPRLGAHWSVAVDASAHPGATLTAVRCHAGASLPPVSYRGAQILVDVGSPFLLAASQASSGGVDTYDFPVPNDPALLGAEATCQAFVFGGSPEPCNALVIEVGN